MTSSTESLNNLKTSSFLHFLFPRFSVWMEVIIDISSSLSLTVGVLKFNVAGEKKFKPIQDGGEGAERPPTSFSSVTSTNVGISS